MSVLDVGKIRDQLACRSLIKIEIVEPAQYEHMHGVEQSIVKRQPAFRYIAGRGISHACSVQFEIAFFRKRTFRCDRIGKIFRERIDVRFFHCHVRRPADARTVRVEFPLHVRIPAEVHVEIPEFERCALDTLREVCRTACRNLEIILRSRGDHDLLPERFEALDGYFLAPRGVRTRRGERHVIGERFARRPSGRGIFERHAPIQARVIRGIVRRDRRRDRQRFTFIIRFVIFLRYARLKLYHKPYAIVPFLRRYHDVIIQVIDRRLLFSEPPIGKALRKHRQHQRGYKQNRKQYSR